MEIPVQERISQARFFLFSVDIYPNGVYNTNTLQGYERKERE